MVNCNQFKTCWRAAAKTVKRLLIDSTENSKAKMASDMYCFRAALHTMVFLQKLKAQTQSAKCKWNFSAEYGQATIEDVYNYDMEN